MRLCVIVFATLSFAAGVTVTYHTENQYESQVYDYYYATYSADAYENLMTGCPEDGTGLGKMLEDVCDVVISGVDKVADKLADDGGIDGFYEVAGCLNGRPTYLRRGNSERDSRRLWFSRMFGDWEISSGVEVDKLDTMLYGGDGADEARPELVASNKWNLAARYSSSADAADAAAEGGYIPVNAVVRCVNHRNAGTADYISASAVVQWAVQFFRR